MSWPAWKQASSCVRSSGSSTTSCPQGYGDVLEHWGYPDAVRFVAVTMLALALVASATAAEAKRRPAPAIAGITLDGKQVSLTKLRGKPVFINVWSSW